MAFYRCSYILRSGEVCNRRCYHPKGCYNHRNSPPQVPCKECGKSTYSKYGICDDHAEKQRKKEQYHRKKLIGIVEHKQNQVNRDVLINQNKLGQRQLLMERPKGQEAS